MAESSSTSKCPHLLVAAFDFGTTYSGYAFSLHNDHLKVQTNQCWVAGSEKLISLKTPTCVLVDPNKKFHSFGFEAENKFASLAEDENHHDWYLFRRFKMLLYKNDDLSRETTIKDISGKSMKAMTIFEMSIRYLKNHLLESLDKQVSGLKETDIQYVITIPAIWDDSAKQFMREAATEAGIETSRLKMALEPEAASIWCQIITTEAKMCLSAIGSQYMVVDLGGGTADISVHEKNSDGTLRELHKASGGAWGGNAVDDSYIQMLTNLFGKSVMERFKKEQMSDYFDILREFETKKRTITPATEGKITFRVSATLKEIYEEAGHKIKDKLASSDLGDRVAFSGDKLRIESSVVKSWFATPIKRLICHAKDILSEPKMKAIDVIVLVGGFGESLMVQEEFKTKLNNTRLVIPNEAGLAVLKGAVRFGHIPDVITSRIMKYTYGVSVTSRYDPNLHPASQTKMCNGVRKCTNLFSSFVRSGEEITVGQNIIQRYIPNDMHATCLSFFCSEDVDPLYITDPGCKRIGKLAVDHPDGDTLDDKRFKATYVFGDTEVYVSVEILKTGRRFYTAIDCL